MDQVNFARLPLEGAYNVRELGGYPCGGGCTKWRAFLRADDLGRLTQRDIELLMAYGLVAVIDLRSASELRALPDPFAQDSRVLYINIPLMNEDVNPNPDLMKTSERIDRPGYLIDAYQEMLVSSKPAIKRIFEFIAGQKPGCVLYHCAGGKDRTGVLSALLLGVAGVGDADILANYSVTYTYLRQNKEMMKLSGTYPPSVMYSLVEYMEPALEMIRAQHGGFENYLLSTGLSAKTVDEVKQRMVCVAP